MAVTIAVSAVIISGFLLGIFLMQSPRTALWGNRLGALSMLAAAVWVFSSLNGGSLSSALLYVAAGAAIGIALGQSVRMIHMPQTVALLNGFGGAASALVAWAAAPGYSGVETALLFWATSGLAVGIGTLTFSGSVIAVLKLQGLAFRQPVQLEGHGHLLRFSILLAALLIIINTAYLGFYAVEMILLIALFGLLAGFLMALRIGGADMPIVISLLNSFSGIAAAVAGLAVENMILAGTGALVGVAGLILTRIMCRAMNRSLMAVLTGFVPKAAGKTKPSAGTAKTAAGKPGGAAAKKEEKPAEAEQDAGSARPEPDLQKMLAEARKIIIVPGYGMAVSQAQMEVRRLVDLLEKEGKEVKFAIHPVAGRMPGHMNVLLAEAGIDYDKLVDLDTINPQFAHADLVIVVGACDVVNPAATSIEGTPISGMPILEADQAKNIVVCNLDENPGYSGVDNLLYNRDHVVALWGDAAQTLSGLADLLEKD